MITGIMENNKVERETHVKMMMNKINNDLENALINITKLETRLENVTINIPPLPESISEDRQELVRLAETLMTFSNTINSINERMVSLYNRIEL